MSEATNSYNIVEVVRDKRGRITDVRLEDGSGVYEVERIAKWIRQNNFTFFTRYKDNTQVPIKVAGKSALFIKSGANKIKLDNLDELPQAALV